MIGVVDHSHSSHSRLHDLWIPCTALIECQWLNERVERHESAVKIARTCTMHRHVHCSQLNCTARPSQNSFRTPPCSISSQTRRYACFRQAHRHSGGQTRCFLRHATCAAETDRASSAASPADLAPPETGALERADFIGGPLHAHMWPQRTVLSELAAGGPLHSLTPNWSCRGSLPGGDVRQQRASGSGVATGLLLPPGSG